MGKKELETACVELGLTIKATFVPYSKSRFAKSGGPDGKPWRSLNWTVALLHRGKEILCSDYSCGTAFTPAEMEAPGRAATVEVAMEVAYQIENGRTRTDGKVIMPDHIDVIACLAADADALDYANFEQWADNNCQDPDSRRAEAAYNAGVRVGLALRAAIGDHGLARLRAAREGY